MPFVPIFEMKLFDVTQCGAKKNIIASEMEKIRHRIVWKRIKYADELTEFTLRTTIRVAACALNKICNSPHLTTSTHNLLNFV